MIVSLRCGENFEMNKMQMLLELAARKFGMPERMAFGAVNEEKFGGNIEVCAMGLCESNDESKTDQSDIGDRQAETKVEAPADAVEDIVENRSNKDDTITSTAEVEKTVSAPVASSAINTPPPVLAAPKNRKENRFSDSEKENTRQKTRNRKRKKIKPNSSLWNCRNNADSFRTPLRTYATALIWTFPLTCEKG